MPPPAKADVALVSLGTTPGLRRADDALAELIAEAGASCRVVRARIGAAGRLRRHPAVTDLVEALAARRAARAAPARAYVYSTVTAALLQPPRGRAAVRFDSPAALNRPGWGGAWQRRRERAALARAELLLPWGAAAARAAHGALGAPPGGAAGERAPAVVALPVPIDAPEPAPARDIDAVAYAGYPRKRGLELLCAAWADAGPPGGRLAIGGLDAERGRDWLRRTRVPEPPGVEWLGALPRERWLATVARARVFVNASRWEDHGLAQLEALAAGCALVTVQSPGAYEALPLARRLAPALVAFDLSADALASALRAGLGLVEAEREIYRERARELLEPYRREAVLATVRERVLPALLEGVR